MKKPESTSISFWSHVLLSLALISSLCTAGCKQEAKPTVNGFDLSASQKSPVLAFTKTITLDELKEHVVYLASDKLEGRFSCTPGARAAAVYIANHFQELGLQGLPDGDNLYFQEFQMQKKKLKECYLENDHVRVENWVHFGERFGNFSGERDVELIFAGYGREADLDRIDIEDKLVAFFPGEPDSSGFDMDKERIKMKSISDRNAAGFLLIFTDESSRAAYERFRKAFYGEPKYYLFKSPEEALDSERNIVIFASDLANLFGINTDKFLSALDEMKSVKDMTGLFSTTVRMKTAYETYSTLEAKNVLGYIEGTDKKDEWIILTAHYDHLGTYRGKIYNGADDNASGVAALLELAKAFPLASQEGHRPRRTLLFMSTDAEEIGANGSLYYVENPLSPLSQTVVDVNIDAIGRNDAKRPDLKDFVYIYCSRNGKVDLDEARQKAEKLLPDKLRIEMRTTPPGSDNHIFERQRVPAIAYTTGYSQDYHKPSDTEDKIDYKNMHKIVRMVFATVWELANRDEGIQRTELE